MLKPNQSTSTKVGDSIGAILNQARSTLNQSRQFRDTDPQDPSSSVSKPRLLGTPQSRIPSSSKVDQNLNRKPSQKISSATAQDLNKQTSTTFSSKNVSVDGSNSKLSLAQKKPTTKLEVRSQGRSQGQDSQLPLAAGGSSNTSIVTPQPVAGTTKQSGANYDYNAIFSNAKSSKRLGRSDFNIFKVGPNPTASVGISSKNESDIGKPPPTPPQEKGRRFGGFIDPSKSKPNEKDDDDDDYSSESSESDDNTSSSYDDSSGHATTDDSDTDGDDSHHDNDQDADDSSTVTPPTITETSASKSKSLGNPTNITPRRMSLKAITLDGENNYGSFSRPDNSRKITMQDLRHKPMVSQASQAVLKAMSPEKDGDFDTYSKQFDNPTPKSYTEDFVSEIQSIADDFSKSFARSVSASFGHTSSDIEVPKTENSSEIPTEASEDSNSSRKMSHHNAMHSLKIVHEIKGNLQDLEILDIVDSFEEDKSATYLVKFNDEQDPKDEYPDDLIITGDGNNTTSPSMASPAEGAITGENSSKSQPKSDKNRSKTPSPGPTGLSDPARLPKSAPSKNKRAVSVLLEPPVKAIRTRPPSSTPILKPSQEKKVKLPPKHPSQIELTLSRASSRKNFQTTLSQVKLRDDDYGPNFGRDEEEFSPILDKPASEKEERARKLELLELKYPYKTPKTKPQTQIHSILEKEVYRKELSRLRKEHRREEAELRMINEARAKNYKKVKDVLEKKDKSKYRQPSLPFPTEEDSSSPQNWGAPYFKKDGSLGGGVQFENLPRTPDENLDNYASVVGGMNVPQLVREVMKSNERMYKMTVKAAKEMGKEYGRNIKVARKIRDMQPLAKE